MVDTPSKKRVRRKEARPQELVAAAVEAFAEQGFAGTKIEDIARRAGVAKGTVYLYFATKDALFEAAVRENISPIFVKLDALASERPTSASQLLTTVIRRVYSELIENPTRRVVMQILITEGSRFPHLLQFYHDEVMAKGKQILRHVIQFGIDAGEFRSSPALAVPEIIMSPAIMAAVWKMSFECISPLDMEQFVAAHIDMVLSGLRKTPRDA
ncbi:MAG: TetR/AcrR family transcriptional regulator [Pirellulales bacterium]